MACGVTVGTQHDNTIPSVNDTPCMRSHKFRRIVYVVFFSGGHAQQECRRNLCMPMGRYDRLGSSFHRKRSGGLREISKI